MKGLIEMYGEITVEGATANREGAPCVQRDNAEQRGNGQLDGAWV